MMVPRFLGLILLSSLFVSALADECGNISAGCRCGRQRYRKGERVVLKCTNTNFQNISVLQNLSPITQILEFTGNNITVFPMDFFGNLSSRVNLIEVDLSDNNIMQITRQSQSVSHVEKLILNHNQISISSNPGMFSNFTNLAELHLADAFESYAPESLLINLRDMFVKSELQKLHKLNLEQNSIYEITDPKIFCNLPELQHIRLGHNRLQRLHFDLECLLNLTFLDLKFNNITTLSLEDLSALDNYTTSPNHNLTIDLSNNSFTGGCGMLHYWLKNTKVNVVNKDSLVCEECPAPVLVNIDKPSKPWMQVSLFIALCVSLALLAYTNRRGCSKRRMTFSTHESIALSH